MSAFDSITIEGAAQGAPPAQAGGSPFDSIRIVDAPKKAVEPPSGGVEGAVRNFVGGTADVVDLVFAGTPAMVLGTFAEGVNRLQGAVSGKPRKQVAEEGAALSTGIGQAFGTPLRTTLTNLGYLRKDEPGAIQQGLGAVMELVERDAAAIEERSGGTVLKQDVMMLVNGLMAAAGVKGTGYGTRRLLDARKAKAAALELDKLKGERAAETAIAEESAKVGETGIDPTPVKTATNLGNAPIIESLTPEALKADKLRRKEVKREMRARFAEDRYEPTRPDSPQAEAARVRGQEDRMPAEGARYEMPRGYGPDPSMDWLRGGAAVGVGLGSLYALSQDNPEVAAAMAAGAFTIKGGRGLTLEALRTMPDATPLGRILDQSAYTLSSLEMLPKNRFEFGKDSVAQLLKRDSVTKAERAILQDVLDSVPGETITAKQLMEGVKERTGDFELKRAESGDFADYGLERIDRASADYYDNPTPAAAAFNARRGVWEVFDPNGDVITEARGAADEASAIEQVRQQIVQARGAQDSATTTIYQSPIELGTANHFGDPNYFAHTRSFTENGVKHVVEQQSDVAQKAGKVLTEGEVEALREQAKAYDVAGAGIWKVIEKAPVEGAPEWGLYTASVLKNLQEPALGVVEKNLERLYSSPVGKGIAETLDLLESGPVSRSEANRLTRAFERAAEQLELRADEARSKFNNLAVLDPIRPMLKDWHKRLVREELADAARTAESAPREVARLKQEIAEFERLADEGGYGKQGMTLEEVNHYLKQTREELTRWEGLARPAVRFADADTVAKVEGWPRADEARAARVEQLQGLIKDAPDSARATGWREELARLEAATNSFSPEHQGIYDRYAKDVTKFLKSLGGKHVVDSAGHGWWEVPVEGSKATPAGRRVQQFGGLDADLAKAVAVIGGGSWIAASLSNPENKTRNALWTAAILGLGLAARSRISGLEDMATSAGHRLENTLGNISSEFRDVSPALLRRLTNHSWDELKLTQDLTQAIAPFLKSLSRVPQASRAALNNAILTGKPGPVLAAMGKFGKPEMLTQWRTVRTTLEKLGTGLIDAGRLKQLLPDYYPRMVIDYPGLLKALGVEAKGYLEGKIDEANKKSIRETGEGLSPLDISLLVNKHLERAINGQGKPGFLKRRSIDEITAELAPFYAPASESLPLYIRAAVKEIERAKFFGRDLVRTPETALTDLDSSIGNLVLRELREGRITEDQMPRVKDLLVSRFGPGERSSSRGIQAFRNMGNAMLLGNVFSALRNLGDLGPIVALHGALPSVKAAIQMATKQPQRITASDMGMAKHLAEEFVHGTRRPVTFKLPLSERQVQLSTAKFVDTTFKLAGWRFLDIGMKELAANAALAKYGRLAQTPKGQAAIRRSYADYFGKDLDALISDLAAGRKTHLTNELAIRELADAQPIFKTEMPKYYLDYPDARVLYMLKSFSIKQLNLVRDRGFKEISHGNIRQGTEFLLRYALLAGTAGMTADNLIRALLGRDTEWEASEIPVHALKNFGWSQYALDKLKAGKTGEAILAVGSPPIDPFVQVLKGDPEAIRYVPLLGKPAYEHGMGGADKANYLARQRKARKERDEADPEAGIERRRRAKEAFERRVRESALETQ